MKLHAITCLSLAAASMVFTPCGDVRGDTTNILYFSDATLGTDQMAAALSALGPNFLTTVAPSAEAFSTDLASGEYKLAIFFKQHNTGYDTQFSQIASFVGGGGSAIVDDWDTNDDINISPLGATYAGGINSDRMRVLGLLDSGVTNPVIFSNPGWDVYNYGLTETTAAIVGEFHSGDHAIIVGFGGRTIVNGFLSDTFSDGQTGVALYTNEITLALAPATPEPSSITILGLGAGLVVMGQKAVRRARSRALSDPIRRAK